jgi:hypothetical protein
MNDSDMKRQSGIRALSGSELDQVSGGADFAAEYVHACWSALIGYGSAGDLTKVGVLGGGLHR